MASFWLWTYPIALFGSVSFGYLLMRFGLPDTRALSRQVKLGISGLAGLILFVISAAMAYALFHGLEYLYFFLPVITASGLAVSHVKNTYFSSDVIRVAVPVAKVMMDEDLIKPDVGFPEPAVITHLRPAEIESVEERLEPKKETVEVIMPKKSMFSFMKEKIKPVEEKIIDVKEEPVVEEEIKPVKFEQYEKSSKMTLSAPKPVPEEHPISEIELGKSTVSKEVSIHSVKEEAEIAPPTVVDEQLPPEVKPEKKKEEKAEEKPPEINPEKERVYLQHRREAAARGDSIAKEIPEPTFNPPMPGQESRRERYSRRRGELIDQAKTDMMRSNEPLPPLGDEDLKLDEGAEGLDLSDLQSVGNMNELSNELGDLDKETSLKTLAGLSELEEVPKEKGMSCPHCNSTKSTIIYCPSCGKGLCSNCATKVRTDKDMVFYTCPSCFKEVIVKK